MCPPDRMYNARTLLPQVLVYPRTDIQYRGSSCMLRHQVARPISSQRTGLSSSRSTLQKLRLPRHGRKTRTFVLFRLLGGSDTLAIF